MAVAGDIDDLQHPVLADFQSGCLTDRIRTVGFTLALRRRYLP